LEAVDVRGQRFSIIGGARSGLAVAKLLKRRGAEVFLSDNAPREKMVEAAADLSNLGIPFEFGSHTDRVLAANVLVLSPGVSSDIPVALEARKRNLRVVSEVEVASWFCPAPIVAVTGTNGKTTTTTLLGRMFEDAKRPCRVSGNIGIAFSQVVDELTKESTAILEISSFQLENIERFRPRVAVLLNITPDHLDRYGNSFERYIAAKARIFENQAVGDVVVYNHDDNVTSRCVDRYAAPEVRRLPFSLMQELGEGAFVRNDQLVVAMDGGQSEVVPVDQISIRGMHNLSNAMAATLAGKAMGVSAASLRATLRNFKGVEHRLEFVRERNGVSFVNDSKATNVDSVWYALQSFSNPIVLLLGGRDKGNDYSRLIPLVRARVKSIVAIGESAGKVVVSFSGITKVVKATTMEEAVSKAVQESEPGDVVLLSPACASFDWFENYEHRGRVFKEVVRKL
jgi:UDP-N-acetylmuramoylalanine--D-glutamate ligase